MENLKCLKKYIVDHTLEHKENISLCELGYAADIIKDLSEALYYCSIVEAMEDEKLSPAEKTEIIKAAVNN